MTSLNSINHNTLADLPKQLKKLLQSTDRGIERLYRTALNSTSITNSSSMVLAHARTYPRHQQLPRDYLRPDEHQGDSPQQGQYRGGKDSSSVFLSSKLEYSLPPTPSELSFCEPGTMEVERSGYNDSFIRHTRENMNQTSINAVHFENDNQFLTKKSRKRNHTVKVNRRSTNHDTQTHSTTDDVFNKDTESYLKEKNLHNEYQNHRELFDTHKSSSKKRHHSGLAVGQHHSRFRNTIETDSPSFIQSRFLDKPEKHLTHAGSGHSSMHFSPGLASARETSNLLADVTTQSFIAATETSTRAFNSPGTTSSSPIHTRADNALSKSWATSLVLDESENSGSNGGQAPITMKSQFGKRWSQAFNSLLDTAESSAGLTLPEKPLPGTSCKEGRKNIRKKKTDNRISTTPAKKTPTLKSDQAVGTSSSLVALPISSEVPPLPKEPVVSLTATDLSATILRLENQLREVRQEKEHSLLHLRLKHAEELASVREEVSKVRTDTAQEITEKLAASYAVKQGVLQSTLELETQRLAETREELSRTTAALDEYRMRLMEREAALEEEKKKDKHLRELINQQEELRKQFLAKDELCEQYKEELKTFQMKEQHWAERDVAWERRLKVLEDRLQEQEEAARTTLHRIEVEFAATTGSYQELLSEATERMGYLEKIHRKYKALREAHTLLGTDKEKQLAESEKCMREWESERIMLREENKALKEQLQSLEDAMQQLSITHKESVEELKRQSELQKSSATDQTKLLQNQVETAHHTIQLLRTQIENLQREIAEEQGHSQEVVMRMAEKELKLQQEKQEQQRSASTYKANSEEAIAALKRQLRAKDAQLLTLAARQDEPLQRLRSQLEDERSRRAQLEAQFNQYKRKAKDAEEAAIREIRKEKLRSSCVTTSFASPVSPGSATATHPRSSMNEGLYVQKQTQHSARGKTSSSASTKLPARYQYRTRSMGSSTPRSGPSSAKWTHQTDSTIRNRRDSRNRPPVSSFRGSISPPQVQVTRVDSFVTGNVIGEMNMGGSQPEEQRNFRGSGNQQRWIDDRESPIAPTEWHKSEPNSAEIPSVEGPKANDSFPLQQFSHVAAALPGSLDPARRPDRVVCSGASTGSNMMPSTSLSNNVIAQHNIEPVGTGSLSTDSISCISNTSPCNSTSQLEHPEEPLFLGMLQEEGSNSKNLLSSKSIEESSSNAKNNLYNGSRPETLLTATVSQVASVQHADTAPWYHFSQKRQEKDRIAPLSVNSQPQQKKIISVVDKPKDRDSASIEVPQAEDQIRHDIPVEDHERRMQQFQASAAEIFKKITNSREEFLTQCTSIVRQSATMCRSSSSPASINRTKGHKVTTIEK